MENIETKETRDKSLDALRGLIMLLMALDHAIFFIMKVHYSEYWSYIYGGHTAISFLTRAASHLCAPGFFFLMGYGAYKKYSQRSEQGQKLKAQLELIFRGMIIILIQLLIENPTWDWGVANSTPGAFEFYARTPGIGNGQIFLGVLFALGAALIVLGITMGIAKYVSLPIGISLILLTQVFVSIANINQDYALWERILLLPGLSGDFHVLYSVLPWLGVAFIGVFFASAKPKSYGIIGAWFVVGFVLLRIVNGFGNTQPYTGGWISFFNVVKYPPSIQFLLLTLGIDFLLIELFKRVKDLKLLDMLIVYGRVPLFFYIVHLYMYLWIGYYFPEGCSYIAMYSLWILGVGILFWPCMYYRKLKNGRFNKILRFL